MASNVGYLSAVLPVFDLLSNCCNQYGLVPMDCYVYCMWAWLIPISTTRTLCVHKAMVLWYAGSIK